MEAIEKIVHALCLTDSISQYNHISLAFITSNLSNATAITDLIIDKSNAEFEKTGLKVLSVIKIHRLITTTDNIIQKVIGVLPESYHNHTLRENKIIIQHKAINICLK